MKSTKKLKVVAIMLTILLALLFFSTSKEETIASGHNMTATTLSMTVGTKQSMTIPGISSSKAKWKSSNTKIATVSAKGVVSAKKAGSATITGTYKGIKFTCKVTVFNKPKYNKTLIDNDQVKVILTKINSSELIFKITNKTNEDMDVFAGADYIKLDDKTYYEGYEYDQSWGLLASKSTRSLSLVQFTDKLPKTSFSKLSIVIEYGHANTTKFTSKRVSVKLK